MTSQQGYGAPRGGAQRPGGPRVAEPPPLSADDARRIIDEGDVELLIARAQSVADRIRGGSDAYSAQIRRLFGEVKRIEMSWTAPESAASRRLFLLKPRLAYQVSRQNKMRPLQQALDPLIDRVGNDHTKFQHFVEFFEAVVAYSK